MTIYALSSGQGISGLAVIRISGPLTNSVINKITNSKLPKERHATRRKFIKIKRQVSFFLKDFYIRWL